MQVQSVPLGSVTIGPPSWSEGTLRSIRRAELLVRQSRSGRSGCSSVTSGTGWSGAKRPERAARSAEDCRAATRESTGATFLTRSIRTSMAPLPPNFLRELCAGASVAMASDYMRKVREVEGLLRRQAAMVAEEGVKLERERSHVERMLCSVRSSLTVNRRSSEKRGCRPKTQESEADGADFLLLWEKRELNALKRDLEAALGDTLTQMQALGEGSRRLLACASERARVLELLPRSGSAGRKNSAQIFDKPDPISPFTPECKQALESSSQTLSQSQQLRQKVRLMLRDAIAKQEATHRTVNDGLVKKIAETVTLQQQLSVTRAATRQAMYRKQREVNRIRHSHDRAQGPECSRDVLSREKLTRPMVQVYQRHPGMQLPEASLLIQGCAVLRRSLRVSEDELSRLQKTSLKLMDDLKAKTVAAQVDAAVVRMRRHQVDKRAVPSFLQPEAPALTSIDACIDR